MSGKAIEVEALKVALRQTKDGVNLTLVIHPDDLHPELLSDPIGSRYRVSFVRVGDDEQPVQRNMAVAQETPLRKAQRAIVASAAILCREKPFQKFLVAKGIALAESEAGAVEALHSYLKVKSRAQLAESDRARRLFISLRSQYEASEFPIGYGTQSAP